MKLQSHSGDSREKAKLSNALLKATRALVDTYTTLIKVYDDDTFTEEEFEELVFLRCSQDDLFVSSTHAILDFIGEECHC